MNKKEILIKKVEGFDSKFFNQDQKTIIIEILKQSPEEQVQEYFDFLIMKKRVGFTFDASPEVAQGRIISLKELIEFNKNIENGIAKNKLLIGDNYNALKCLNITHKNKIDVIYIDPPYNTDSAKDDGNHSSKDGDNSGKFIYKDKFGRNGWLNMMNDRLRLAKELMSDEGVIFVSIDDSEQAYLKVLMDEIFGEENFLNQLVWVSKKSGRQISGKPFAKTYEYILMYSKTQKVMEVGFGELERKEARRMMPSLYEDKNEEVYTDEYGEYISNSGLQNTNPKLFNINTRPNLFFPIYIDPNENKISIEPFENSIEINPPISSGVQGVWRWSKSKVESESHNLKIVKKSNDEYWINTKVREMTYTPKDIIISPEMSTRSGNVELENILGKGKFSYPKPTSLIKFLISISSQKKDSIILDFFAGSGTTAQAVIDLNREDSGERSFIVCTNNENEIAKEVTHKRIISTMRDIDSLRVIEIDDSQIISLEEDIDETYLDEKVNEIKLLDETYNKKDLSLYYDLAALNPLEKNDDTN